LDARERDVYRLQRTVKDLVYNAEENQRILQYFHEFELRLLACRSLAELLDCLLVDAVEYFDLGAVSLVLFDPEGAARELLEDLDTPDYGGRLQFRSSQHFFVDLYGEQKQTQLGPLEILERAKLFPGGFPVETAALLPLLRQNLFIGSYHLGSRSEDRFTRNKAVDFISHLASIIGVCIENCINQEHLRRLSLIDVLTRVKNRRAFDLDLDKEISRASRTGSPLSFLFIDLDHFKKVNDVHGHQTGDRALKVVAQAAKQQLRKTDHIARFGGEEFAALLPCCPKHKALEIAERVCEQVKQVEIRNDDDEAFQVTLSIGLTTWEPGSRGAINSFVQGEKIIAAADHAVYLAKDNGRDQVCFEAVETVAKTSSSASA